jgi:alkanesulfonate monooxygenase SsuD/methylene tetrahydromethanopterin reductase-like flavin-dependent oxidoreductase (luciferase family)
MAAAVDDLSEGRLRLGLGAGWQAREHRMFGRALLDVGPRFDRYREYLEVVTRLLQSDEPVSFEGEYYTLREAILLPRPQRPGGPPITVGGNGRNRTLPLAAEFADEWNAVYCTPARWTDLNARLDRLLAAQGRDPDEVRRTMMTGIVFGEDESALRARLASRGQSAQEARENGAIVGTPGAVRDQLGALMDAGLDGVMLQWLDLDDVDGLASFSQAVI